MTRAPLFVALVLVSCSLLPRSTAPLAGVTIGYTSPHFGFAVCTPAALHDCITYFPLRGITQVTPSVDVAAGCLTEATVVAACPGEPSRDPAVQRCYAEHGVFIDLFAAPDPSRPSRSSHFVMECREGIAEIDFIEPW